MSEQTVENVTCESGNCGHGCGFLLTNNCKRMNRCDHCHHPVCAGLGFLLRKAQVKVYNYETRQKAKQAKREKARQNKTATTCIDGKCKRGCHLYYTQRCTFGSDCLRCHHSICAQKARGFINLEMEISSGIQNTVSKPTGYSKQVLSDAPKLMLSPEVDCAQQ